MNKKRWIKADWKSLNGEMKRTFWMDKNSVIVWRKKEEKIKCEKRIG